MTIFAIGINDKTASLKQREAIYFTKDKLAQYLQDLISQGYAREALLLSTCNRSELYCDTSDVAAVLDWFSAQTALPRAEIDATLYVHEAEAAVSHMMAVAVGLDSMVLGESQILGQMKEAFAEALAAGAIGTSFHRLFQRIFAVAKEVRTATAIGACPISIASAAIYFAKQLHPHFVFAKVAVIGAGETAELTLRYLSKEVTQPIALVNRRLEKALSLSKQYAVSIHSLDNLEAVLKDVDIVFSATGSVMPLITTTLMQTVMMARAQKPLLLIDIAVPRDVEAAVATLPFVEAYCIDDLKKMIEQHTHGRQHAAEKAREMIHHQSKAFMHELTSFDKIASTIRAYRNVIEDIAFSELAKTKQQLKQGVDPQIALEHFVHAFTNKLMHEPSVQLRQAGVEGRFELLRYAKQLFAIPDHEAEAV